MLLVSAQLQRAPGGGAWSAKSPRSHIEVRGGQRGESATLVWGEAITKRDPKIAPYLPLLDVSRPALPLLCRLPRVCCPQLRSLISTEDAALPDGATEVVTAIQQEQGHVVSCPVELTITRGDCWAGEVRHNLLPLWFFSQRMENHCAAVGSYPLISTGEATVYFSGSPSQRAATIAASSEPSIKVRFGMLHSLHDTGLAFLVQRFGPGW
jgi:hypothetical protein